MGKNNKINVENTWNNFWNNYSLQEDSISLKKYRNILLENLESELQNRSHLNINVLNAGCGIDPIPIYLLKKCDSLTIYLLDISQRCLDLNKSFFEDYLSSEMLKKVKFIKGDIFNLEFENNSFDIVYNTGVLEHFEISEQVLVLREFERVLKPGGCFISLNPSKKGILYVFMKNYLEKKDEWEFGPEYPVSSLKRPIKCSFTFFDLEEVNLDFQDSAMFVILHGNWIVSCLGRILHELAYNKFFEVMFLKLFGGYILLTKVYKK